MSPSARGGGRRKWVAAAALMAAAALLYALVLTAFKGIETLYQGASNVQEGKPAPEFALKSLTGQEVRLTDYRGRPTLLFFWADWCAACKHSFPMMEEIDGNNDFSLRVVTVATNSELEEVRRIVRQRRLRLPTLFDEGDEVADAYAVRAFPTIVLVDGDGVLLFKQEGAKGLRERIESALKTGGGQSARNPDPGKRPDEGPIGPAISKKLPEKGEREKEEKPKPSGVLSAEAPDRDSEKTSLKPGGLSPAFDLKDLNGLSVRSEALAGKPLLIYFWADWCPSCKLYLPEIQKLHDELRRELNVVSIATNSDLEKVRSVVRKGNYNVPVLYDLEDRVGGRFEIEAYPTVSLIGADRRVLFHHAGAEEIRSEVEAALRGGEGYLKVSSLLEEGKLLIGKKRFDKAEEALKKAMEIDPDNVEVWHQRGHAAYARKDYEQAIRRFQKVLDANPAQPCALHGVIGAHMELGRFDIARSLCEKAIEQRPWDAHLWGIQGQIDSRIAKQKIARSDWAPGGLKGLDADALCEQGRFLYQSGEYQSAWPYLRLASEKGARACWREMTHVCAMMEEFETGMDLLNAMRYEAVKEEEYCFASGYLLEALGKREEAARRYQFALTHSPGMKEAREGLARISAKKGSQPGL